MKRNSPNPKIIGAFVTVMLALIVAMVMYFGTANFLNRSTHFILFFDQSVNGLQVGSAVKFRGVPVGEVRRIMIRAEGQHDESTAIPVVIKINQSRLENDLGVSRTAFAPESIHESLERGLVAQLNLESLITGQLFVEFSFEPEKTVSAQTHLAEVNGMVEIPTLNSSLDEITADVAQIIADVKELDLHKLSNNINNLLISATTQLDGLNTSQISSSITETADEIKVFVASEQFSQSVDAMRVAFEQVTATAQSFDLNDGPLSATIQTWTQQITDTLASLDNLTQDANALLQPGSDMRHEFESMLRELGRAARSVRLLSEYLERNPNALLTGRSEQKRKP
ncbi:MlaD family protein [Coraliomargarita sp. SDUM461004]|uniref:MlaD family protein n=1 Tax=Thalassobacterium sedimentorum TaxID=3041258 RepID=A0ABU1AJQ4_9BACT|nr:MlaD family protein [Coraliomargarita sp. SDUM461004]MDQ8193838.1 MlaD family protein [Coraliomargarita sp. SDUM461004]